MPLMYTESPLLIHFIVCSFYLFCCKHFSIFKRFADLLVYYTQAENHITVSIKIKFESSFFDTNSMEFSSVRKTALPSWTNAELISNMPLIK